MIDCFYCYRFYVMLKVAIIIKREIHVDIESPYMDIDCNIAPKLQKKSEKIIILYLFLTP